MSGHSKWSTIKRKKGAADAKRGQLFTRLGREIALAAREGGGDPDANFKLRLAVDKARANNMPKENIERAIMRGAGGLKGEDLAEVWYEGYAPHGVAVIVHGLTDNRNRTVSEVRRALTRAGGNMAGEGAVSWQFQRKGYLSVPTDDVDPDTIFETAVEAGADDVVVGDEEIEIFTPMESFQMVRQTLLDVGVEPTEADLTMVPTSQMELSPQDTVQVMGVIEALEEIDDVQQVFSNLHISDAVMAEYEAAAA
jgi:YebC/PmpR family DNA-binding regulatory protein